MAWTINSVFGVKPGYDVKLIESNGRGHESFTNTIAQSEREYCIAIVGSTVLIDGGTGFVNAEVHKSIRADIIKSIAKSMAYTINTQIVPQFVLARWGEEALIRSPALEWDVVPPKDLKDSAEATSAFGDALGKANESLRPYGVQVEVTSFAAQFGIPIIPIEVEEPESGVYLLGEKDVEDDDGEEVEIDFQEAA